MNRYQFQKLAELRIEDAKALLNQGRFSASYYFSGLAVECALKACIAKKTAAYDFPDLKRAQKSWIHDLDELQKSADLADQLSGKRGENASFAANWNTVKEWQINSRYDSEITRTKAEELFRSVTEPIDGVIPWLRTLW